MNLSAAGNYMPFDPMVGVWIATGMIFDPKGKRRSVAISRNLIYWKNRPTLMHFRQDQNVTQRIGEPSEEADLRSLLGDEGVRALEILSASEYDLTINGKRGTASSMTIDLAGTETTPDAFQFELKEKGTGLRLRWHNSHMFTGPNEKRIMGPVLDFNGLLGLIMVQTLTRVSHDVPSEMQRELPK